MRKSAKALTDAFTSASKKGAVFGEDHKVQIDALRDLADDINAEGVFSAELRTSTRGMPVLMVTHKSDGYSQLFFTEFGDDAFGGGKTLKLSIGLDETPPGGKPEGYSLQLGSDREACLKMIGETLACRTSESQLGAAIDAYMHSRRVPKP